MPEPDLRAVVIQHLSDTEQSLDVLANDLSTLHELIAERINAVQHLLKANKQMRLAFETAEGENTAGKSVVLKEPPPPLQPESVGLTPFEQELVDSYNSEEPNKWRRKYSAEEFGAENVNAIWEKGGEPRFVKKEGGIYNLVAAEGACYVVTDPGHPLNEGYLLSEGLETLFDISQYDLEAQQPVVLLKPGTVEEISGRWRVAAKGLIRG